MHVMRMPGSVDLGMTTRCNLRCSYCFHFGSAGEVESDLPTEERVRFIEELGRINRDDFLAVWQEHPQLQRFRERVKTPLSELGFCSRCEYITQQTGDHAKRERPRGSQ